MKHPKSRIGFRRWTFVATVVAALAGLALLHGAESGKSFDLREDLAPLKAQVKAETSHAAMIKKVTPSVVNIFTTKTVSMDQMQMFNDPFYRRFFGNPQMPRKQKQTSLGSGVIVSADGYILTNNHVVAEADEIKVSLADGKTEYEAKLVGRDPKTDVAVLKVDAKKLPAITITASSNLEVGDMVFAIGDPFGVGQTVTSGIVSAVGRGGLGITDYEDFIQTDASINPGNSGGALVDAEGRLVGINTAILSRTGGNNGIGFAVPIDLAKGIMERLVTSGKVDRGFLGVVIQEITPDLAKEFKLKDTVGALVSDVNKDSAADVAGIKSGDVIVAVNNEKVDDVRHLRLLVAGLAPDTKIEVTILRKGKTMKLPVTLKAWPEGTETASAMEVPENAPAGALARSLELQDLTADIRQQLNIPASIKGPIIAAVEDDSPAAEAGLARGTVILEIDQKPVASAADAYKALAQVKDKSVLFYVWVNGHKQWVPINLGDDRN